MKRAKTIMLISIIFSALLMAFMLFQIIREEGWNWGMIAVVVGSLAIMMAVMIPILRSLQNMEVKNGLPAKATVLKVWDTGVSLNDNPQVGLLLEVMPDNAAPFQAETKTIVSRLNAALVQPGVELDVKYDPNNHKRIEVVTIYMGDEANPDPAERLERLENLRLRHLISQQEYESKREEILKAL